MTTGNPGCTSGPPACCSQARLRRTSTFGWDLRSCNRELLRLSVAISDPLTLLCCRTDNEQEARQIYKRLENHGVAMKEARFYETYARFERDTGAF